MCLLAASAILVTEIVFAAAFLVVQPIFMTIGWHHLQVALSTPFALVGAWHLDAAHPASGVFIDPEGLPITDLYVAPSGRAYIRSTDGELWLSIVNLDPKKHTVRNFFGGRDVKIRSLCICLGLAAFGANLPAQIYHRRNSSRAPGETRRLR